MSPEETRRIRSRANSKQYYESHREVVKARVREHAHGKRRQLDESLKLAQEVLEEALIIREALTIALSKHNSARVQAPEEFSHPSLTTNNGRPHPSRDSPAFREDPQV